MTLGSVHRALMSNLSDIVIEEFSQEELEKRGFRSKGSNSSKRPVLHTRPVQPRLSSSNRLQISDNNSSGFVQPASESQNASQQLNQSCIETLESDSSGIMEIETHAPRNSNIIDSSWPGHIVDIDFVVKEKYEYSPSREGHLAVDLISHLIFLWGLSSAPLQSMKQIIKSEIASATRPPQSEPLMDVFEDNLDDEDCLDSQTESNTPDSAVIVGEFGIEVETGPKQYVRKKLVFSTTEEVEDELPIRKPSRSYIMGLQRKEKTIDAVHTQLDTLRKLIMADVQQPSHLRTAYLSHIFLFIGASVTTAKFAFCLLRSPHIDDQTVWSSTDPLPLKTRPEDAWIRSTLRSLLQKDIGTSSIRPTKSKMANRISLVVAYSALPNAAIEASLSPSVLDDMLVQIRIPDKWLNTWNPRKPMRVIRMGDTDKLSSVTPFYSARIGQPMYLL